MQRHTHIFLSEFTTKTGTSSGSCHPPQQKEKKKKRVVNQAFGTKRSQTQSLYPTQELLDEKSSRQTTLFLWLIYTLWKLESKRREQRETYSGLTTVSASTKLKKSFWNASQLLKEAKERSEMKSQLNRKAAKRKSLQKCQQKILVFFSPGVFVIKQSGAITQESWLAPVLANLHLVQKQIKSIKMPPSTVHMSRGGPSSELLRNQFPLSTSSGFAENYLSLGWPEADHEGRRNSDHRLLSTFFPPIGHTFSLHWPVQHSSSYRVALPFIHEGMASAPNHH